MIARSAALLALVALTCSPVISSPVRADEELAGIDPAQSGTRLTPTRLEPGSVAAAIPAVTGLRIGRHGARTRVVFDVTGRPDFEHRTTASGRSVLISFPAATWQAPTPPEKGIGLVRKVRFGLGEGGRGDIAILAAEPVTVAKAFALEPKDEGSPWRVVLDLIPLDALTTEERAEALAPAKPAPTFGKMTVTLAED